MKKTETQTTRHPRVFVIQDPKPRATDGWVPDLSTAAQYGGFYFVFDKTDRAHLDPGMAQDQVAKVLSDFDPEQDYLLPTIFGDPATTWVSLFWLAPILKKAGHEFVNFLYWNRGKGEEGMTNANGYYSPIKVPL